MRVRLVCLVAGLVFLGGCSGSSPSPSAPPPSPSPTCPVEDTAACARLAEGVTALTDRDAAAVRALSIEELGVGTCGPADPTRRSYHLAFATGDRLGSLEFVQRSGQWSVGLLYVDTVAEWRKEHDDPQRDIACGNVRPWV